MAEVKCYKLTDYGLKLVGVVDDYTSFTFTRKYSDVGEWQLVSNALSDNAKLISGFDFIAKEDGVAGIVKKVSASIGDNNTITYSGTELKGIINQRIVMPPSDEAYQSYSSTAPETVMANIISQQLINCEVAQRQIPYVRIADYYIIEGRTIDYNGRFGNAYDDITTIATTNNIGWYADIQPIEGNEQYAEIVFHIYNGLDRSTGQSENSRLILSYENDSLASTLFETNKGVPTTAIIAGQGEGVDRTIAKINDATTGLERNELFIDARDLADETLLPQRGQEALAGYGDTANYQITFNQLLIERYRNDFDLGDIGTIEDSIVGSTIDFRLTEITEILEQGEYKIDVTFGYDKQTLGDALRRSNSSTQSLLKVEGVTSGGSGNIDAGTLDGNTISDLLLMIYPVGSIYTSVNSASPATLFGGTWEAFASGRTLVGIDTNDGDFNTVEKTGGNKNLQQHNHTINHSHGTITSTNESANHTHSFSATTGTESADHAHYTSGTTGGGGAHWHSLWWPSNGKAISISGSNGGGTAESGYSVGYSSTTVYTESFITRTAADHAHSFGAWSGGRSAAHTHGVSGTTAGISTNHTHNITVPSYSGNSGNAGTGNSGNLQPYITVYMWKRTA